MKTLRTNLSALSHFSVFLHKENEPTSSAVVRAKCHLSMDWIPSGNTELWPLGTRCSPQPPPGCWAQPNNLKPYFPPSSSSTFPIHTNFFFGFFLTFPSCHIYLRPPISSPCPPPHHPFSNLPIVYSGYRSKYRSKIRWPMAKLTFKAASYTYRFGIGQDSSFLSTSCS